MGECQVVTIFDRVHFKDPNPSHISCYFLPCNGLLGDSLGSTHADSLYIAISEEKQNFIIGGEPFKALKFSDNYKQYTLCNLAVKLFSEMPPKGSKKAKAAEAKDATKTNDNKGKKVKNIDTKDDDESEEDKEENSKKKEATKKPAKQQKVEEKESDDQDEQEENSEEKKPSSRGWGWGHKRKSDPNDPEPSKSKAKKKRDSIVGSFQGIDFTAKAKSPKGKEANFKIASWNVNGLRAWLEKDGLEYVKAENPDVFCVQETKCDKSKIPAEAKLEGYTDYWLSGDTEGYSGVGIYYKTKPIKITEGIGIDEHDQEGRVITAEFEKFYLVNTYVPNSGRGLPRLDYRTQDWDTAFRNYLKSLDKKKPVVWCGDLNVAHKEIDLKNPKGNLKTAGFTEEERDSFTDTLKEGFFDSFRFLHPKEEHAYTFWTYMMNARAKNAGWRLDYFVLSEKLKENLCDSSIRSKVLGSDHCPIVRFPLLENLSEVGLSDKFGFDELFFDVFDTLFQVIAIDF
ncbi:DNA-(apurinic or apyrimidinic site) lyase [Bulinus truncatus]|nr:DNA-(apurinic or apyrimidinic site) lyase [Bulinus truncatus]